MIRRPPRSTQSRSSAASDVYKRQCPARPVTPSRRPFPVSSDTSGKVTAARLGRDAYLYVRQSTLYQVANNTESTARQYDLRGRAVALGWPADRVHVIDIDQGHSGASSADREGFRHLVAEVSLGRAGIILGLECSRPVSYTHL